MTTPRRPRHGLGGAALVWLMAGPVAALIGPINVTNKVESTRAQAFGGAATALGNDPTLVWINPASPAEVSGSSVTLGGQRGYFDDMTGQGLVTLPVSSGMLSVGALYYDEGQTVAFRPDDSLVNAKLQQDILGAAGYALRLTPRVSTGALVKTFHSRLAEQATTTAVAGDLGIQIRVTPALKLGAVIQNIGTPLRFEQDPVALPTVARAGAAAGWRFASPGAGPGRFDTLILVTDAEYQVADRVSVWHAGVEYQWRGLIALRAGSRLASRQEPGTVAAGLGLRWERFRIDYTMRLSHDYEAPQTLALTIALPAGGPGPAAVAAPPPAEARMAPALPDQETALRQPAISPEAEPAEPTVLPEQKHRTPADESPPGGENGLIDDLNRHLDELLKPDGKSPNP